MSRTPRIRLSPLARGIGAALLVGASPGALSAQGIVSPACQETCPNGFLDPAGAAACAARIAGCQTKLGLYQTYMLQLGSGAVFARLTPLYQQILRPHYPTVGLNAWRFAWADRQPPNNTTTDCATTYFNPNATYANTLAQGNLTGDGEMELLFHELAHVEQCMRVGGRDLYAKMWFADVEAAWLEARMQINDWAAIHAIQPMENEARDKATQVLAATRRNRNTAGAFIPPQADLGVASVAMVSNPRAGTCTIRVTVENMGTAPLGIAGYNTNAVAVRVTTGTTGLGEITLPALDPVGVLRETPPRNIRLTWRPSAVYTFNGTRSFVIQTDPNRVLSDSNRNNNLREGRFTCDVSPPTIRFP